MRQAEQLMQKSHNRRQSRKAAPAIILLHFGHQWGVGNRSRGVWRADHVTSEGQIKWGVGSRSRGLWGEGHVR